MKSSATTMVRLRHDSEKGASTAVIDCVGAGLHALCIDDRDVMPADTEWSRRRWFSGHTLAPWPNRMRDAHWEFDGEILSTTANDGLGNALHGLVAQREFSIVAQTPNAVSLELLLGGDVVYPFNVRVLVEYRIEDSGLSCTFGAVNESARPVPFAIGTHPFFPFDDACTLTISATQAFEVDERLLPTGVMLDLSAWAATAGEPIPLATFTADDCFTAHTRDALGRAHTYITYTDGSITDVWQDQDLGHTVIFTTREFQWSDGTTNAIAIEPQTAPTNAFNSGVDLQWLEPGEQRVVRWGVSSTAPQASR